MQSNFNTVRPVRKLSISSGATAAVAIVLVGTVVLASTAGAEDPRFVLEGSFPFPTGDDSAFSSRSGLPDEPSGGVRSFEWSSQLSDDTAITTTGRALFDAHDYLARVRLNADGKGFVEGGYEEFRTYYDGTGGFFPGSGGVFGPDPFGDAHDLDRGKAWLSAGLRREGFPELDFDYRYRFREGSKDSLVRGDVGAGSAGVRRIAPGFREIDERYHSVDVELRHEVSEATDLGAGFVYESSKIDGALGLDRSPDESGLERKVTQRDGVDGDLMTARAFASTRLFEDRVTAGSSYAFTRLDNDVSGSRIYGADFSSAFDPLLANRQRFDRGFLDLAGDTKLQRHSGRSHALARIDDGLALLFGLAVEREEIDAQTTATDTVVGGDPALTTDETDFANAANTSSTSFAENVELRFTAIEGLSLFARLELEQSDGDLSESRHDTDASTLVLARDTNFSTRHTEVALGGTWYPSSRWNVATKLSYIDRTNDFDHRTDIGSPNDATGTPPSTDRFPAYLTSEDSEEYRAEVRATVRAHATLRAVARYEGRWGTIDSRVDGLGDLQAAELESHRIGNTLTWTPLPSAWSQAEINYVTSRTQTPTADASGAAAGLVGDFDNDYWNVRLNAGAALDESTDVEASYNLFWTENFQDGLAIGQPYGQETEEHAFMVGVAHRLSENIRVAARYAYIHSDERTQGGQDDYEANLLRTTIEYGF